MRRSPVTKVNVVRTSAGSLTALPDEWVGARARG